MIFPTGLELQITTNLSSQKSHTGSYNCVLHDIPTGLELQITSNLSSQNPHTGSYNCVLHAIPTSLELKITKNLSSQNSHTGSYDCVLYVIPTGLELWITTHFSSQNSICEPSIQFVLDFLQQFYNTLCHNPGKQKQPIQIFQYVLYQYEQHNRQMETN